MCGLLENECTTKIFPVNERDLFQRSLFVCVVVESENYLRNDRFKGSEIKIKYITMKVPSSSNPLRNNNVALIPGYLR